MTKATCEKTSARTVES